MKILDIISLVGVRLVKDDIPEGTLPISKRIKVRFSPHTSDRRAWDPKYKNRIAILYHRAGSYCTLDFSTIFDFNQYQYQFMSSVRITDLVLV